MLIRAPVLIYTKVPPKKNRLKQKKLFFCLCIKKNNYLWYNNNIKTHNNMKPYYFILAALSLIALAIGIHLFALNIIANNIPTAFAYLLLFMAATFAAATAIGNIQAENEK